MTVTPRRGWLIAAYLLLAAAGAASLVWRSPTVSAAGHWSILWSALLIIGGVASAGGVLRNHWIGEWCGLLPLVAVWVVYGLTAGYVIALGDPTRLPAALALLAIACFMLWRWQIVAGERQAAREVRTRHTGG